MISIVSIENMRRIEAAADANGLTYDEMMDSAGHATGTCAIKMLQDAHDASIIVLIGTGNNGGDGLVAAQLLAEHERISVTCYLLKPRAKSDRNFQAAKDAGATILIEKDDPDGKHLRTIISTADLIIDALFGIGIRLPLKGKAAAVLKRVKDTLSERRWGSSDEDVTAPASPDPTSRLHVPKVLAVDCPSGLDCDTGIVDDNAIPADETITFIAAKPGLLRFPGAKYVGKLSIASVGVSSDLPEMQESHWLLAEPRSVHKRLPERRPNSHKGTYGKTFIVAGSLNYIGAPRLAAEAAYRAGTGLVTVGAPGSIVPALSANLPEPTWVMLPHDMGVISEKAVPLVREQCEGYQALLLGPGLGQEDTTRTFVQKLLEFRRTQTRSLTKRPIGFSTKAPETERGETLEGPVQLPALVIDADGLNLLMEVNEWWTLLPSGSIITPHPGEMSRLAGLPTKEIQNNRYAVAVEKAESWDVVLVLKGAHTLIAAPGGQVTTLPFKTDGLATAGTGDILAGLIVGLVAQGVQPFDAAIIGGYVHGLAGDLAQQQHGSGRSVIARDVLGMIPEAWRMLDNS